MRALDDIAREVSSNYASFDAGAIDLAALAERQELLLAPARAAGQVDEVLTLVGDSAPRSAANRIAKWRRDDWKSWIGGHTPDEAYMAKGLRELDLIRRAGLTVLVTKAGYALADAERGL